MDLNSLFHNAHGVELVGPFIDHYTYRVSVDGYLVPHIKAMLQSGTEDTWNLSLDERCCLESVPGDALRQWLPFLANAMAVAAGYSSHGENSQQVNPFNVRFSALGDDAARRGEGAG